MKLDSSRCIKHQDLVELTDFTFLILVERFGNLKLGTHPSFSISTFSTTPLKSRGLYLIEPSAL